MAAEAPRTIGSYRLYEKIGSGGMGSVYLGRLFASGGFRRIVAIKSLHPHFVDDASFVTAFLDEARLASRIHHPNVVAPLDVVAESGEVFLVFEHVMGVALSSLLRRAVEKGDPIPPRVAAAIMVNVLDGLHAAHEAKGDHGEPLGLIHRDVSPQNILVGKDGVSRLLDFGIAKATGRSQITAEGLIKGKRGYMAPEHMMGHTYPGSDVYSAAVVLWELLANRRLFPDETSISKRISGEVVDPPSTGSLARSTANLDLDKVVLRGLAPDTHARYQTAREMAVALEEIGAATPREVGEWVARAGEPELTERARLVDLAESALDTPIPKQVATRGAHAFAHATLDAISDEAPDTEATAPERSKRRAVVVGVALLLFSLVGALFLTARPAAPTPSVTSGSSASATPPGSATMFANAPLPSPPPTSEPLPASTASADSPTGTKPKSVSGPSPAKKRANPGCKAYVIDKNGHTQFNEECLR